MEPVSILVFNTLARRRGVNLPGIGSLGVASRPAAMEEAGTVTPPVNRIVLSRDGNPGFVDIVDQIALMGGSDRENAQEFYNEWLAGVCSDEGIVIDSVGRIRDDVFTPDEELSHVLNPAGMQPVVLPRQAGQGKVVLWIAIAVVIGVVLAIGSITLLERYYESHPLTAERQADSEAPVAALTGGRHRPQPDTSAATNAVVPETTPEADTAKQAAAVLVPATRVPDATEKPVARPAPTASGTRYCVIVGAYSTDANAEKFIASAKKKDGSLTFEKLPQRNGRILVSVFSAATEQDALQKKREYSDRFDGLWVYKSRPE